MCAGAALRRPSRAVIDDSATLALAVTPSATELLRARHRRVDCREPYAPISVGNTVFSAFPPLQAGRPALPRPEGPRQSLRSGSRSDSFRGSVQGGCTEMHYSPRIWQRRGPELPLLFPLPILPSPSSSLLSLFSPRPGSQGGRRFVTMAHNRLLLYSAFDDDQPLPIYPVSGARQGTVHLSAIRVLHYIVARKLLMVLPRA